MSMLRMLCGRDVRAPGIKLPLIQNDEHSHGSQSAFSHFVD